VFHRLTPKVSFWFIGGMITHQQIYPLQNLTMKVLEHEIYAGERENLFVHAAGFGGDIAIGIKGGAFENLEPITECEIGLKL